MKTRSRWARVDASVLARGLLFAGVMALAQTPGVPSALHAGGEQPTDPQFEDIGFGRCSPEDAKKALREFFEGYEGYEKKNQLVKLKAGDNSTYLTRMRDFLKSNPAMSSAAWNAGWATFEMFDKILPVPAEDKVKLGEIDALVRQKLVGTPYEKKDTRPEVKRAL